MTRVVPPKRTVPTVDKNLRSIGRTVKAEIAEREKTTRNVTRTSRYLYNERLYCQVASGYLGAGAGSPAVALYFEAGYHGTGCRVYLSSQSGANPANTSVQVINITTSTTVTVSPVSYALGLVQVDVTIDINENDELKVLVNADATEDVNVNVLVQPDKDRIEREITESMED